MHTNRYPSLTLRSLRDGEGPGIAYDGETRAVLPCLRGLGLSGQSGRPKFPSLDQTLRERANLKSSISCQKQRSTDSIRLDYLDLQTGGEPGGDARDEPVQNELDRRNILCLGIPTQRCFLSVWTRFCLCPPASQVEIQLCLRSPGLRAPLLSGPSTSGRESTTWDPPLQPTPKSARYKQRKNKQPD
jgi:hypothetical protein